MLLFCYAEWHLLRVNYAGCRYAECRYAECHYAECRAACTQTPLQQPDLDYKVKYNTCTPSQPYSFVVGM
jgi:hypothetical protein